MGSAFFIAWHDIRYQLRQGSTLLWVFVMPPVFFYFIGTVTSGFSVSMGTGAPAPLIIAAPSPGFTQDQIDKRFARGWVRAHVV